MMHGKGKIEMLTLIIGYQKIDELLYMQVESRRLPAYASSGKLLMPPPVFWWQSGQKLNQTLLNLQIPLLKKITKKEPSVYHTIIVSGDVYIHTESLLSEIPEADVVCFGVSVNPDVATHHGVFICPRKDPTDLEYMLQKPSISNRQVNFQLQ